MTNNKHGPPCRPPTVRYTARGRPQVREPVSRVPALANERHPACGATSPQRLEWDRYACFQNKPLWGFPTAKRVDSVPSPLEVFHPKGGLKTEKRKMIGRRQLVVDRSTPLGSDVYRNLPCFYRHMTPAGSHRNNLPLGTLPVRDLGTQGLMSPCTYALINSKLETDN